METKLYVGNLSYDTTEDELRTLFTEAGTVSEVALIKDRYSGTSKGFAFVTMGSQAEANKAIEQFNKYSLGNRELTVNMARPRENSFDNNQRGGYGNNNRNRGGGNRRY